MPTRSHARRLPLMYEALAGSSPTSTTARQGARCPAARSAATFSARSFRISSASARPSTTTVRTGDPALISGGRLRRLLLPLALAFALVGVLRLARRVVALALGGRAAAR